MVPTIQHEWPRTVAEARALQHDLRDRVVDTDAFGPVRRIAGADVSYDRGRPELYAAVVVGPGG